MAEGSREEFRHRELADRFRLANDLFVPLLQSSILALFGLMAGSIFLIAAVFVVPGARGLAGSVPAEWLLGGWFALAVPITAYMVWRRWMQVQRNYVVVDDGGIEYHRYPRAPLRVHWGEFEKVRFTYDPDPDYEGAADLVFRTTRGNFRAKGDDWPVHDIARAVEKHFRVERVA